MAKHTGILLDDNLDLKVEVVKDSDGLITQGIVVGDTTYQNQILLLHANKGEIKEFPTSGVGVQNYLEDDSSEALAREIRSEFTDDGMTVSSIEINMPQLNIEANYND